MARHTRSDKLVADPRYVRVLNEAFAQAQALLISQDKEAAIAQYVAAQPALRHALKTRVDGAIVPLGKTVAEGVGTIISNFRSSRYIYSVLITGLVEKVVHPQQDIRLVQSDMPGGYSNRNTDEQSITPTLKSLGLTHMAASGMESGRNFERPEAHTFGHSANIRGTGTKDAYLAIVHAVQVEGVDPKPILALLMALDRANQQSHSYTYPQPVGLTIEQIVSMVLRHFTEAKGNGRARLPVLAIQAVYTCLTPEVARYRGTRLRNPPNRHTGNDKEGWIGDIQVDRVNEQGAFASPFEAVEVKADKQITADMVLSLVAKFRGEPVDRYYILSTNNRYIAEGQDLEVMRSTEEVRRQTGCQVIANGLQRTLWYYLRMLNDPSCFITSYTEQVQTDPDTQPEHRGLWSRILAEFQPEQVS